MPAIEIDHVSKEYAANCKGLDEVSLSIGPGVYGLLGHNGAGKTTLMRILSTILAPTEGSVRIMGFDTKSQGDQVRRRIGYLPQELSLYPNLSALESVQYMASLKGIKGLKHVYEAIEKVGLADEAKKKIKQLSGGMKRRVGIAQAMVGEPDVLIVDEPTAGLDPEERVRFRGILSQYSGQGKTVLLSTHIIEDVQSVCSDMAVLRHGKLFYAGPVKDLIRYVQGRVKTTHLSDHLALQEFQTRYPIISVTYENNVINARFVDEDNSFPSAPATETLEDAYVYCMGGKARV